MREHKRGSLDTELMCEQMRLIQLFDDLSFKKSEVKEEKNGGEKVWEAPNFWWRWQKKGAALAPPGGGEE